MKRSLLIFAALCAASWTSVQAAQPTVDPVFASDVVDRYANHIYYGSGATGMALVMQMQGKHQPSMSCASARARALLLT